MRRLVPQLTSMSGAVMVPKTITTDAATAAASLGDFDNLQSDQLDLGAAILQHLLSCGQHLILDNNITLRDKKPHFNTNTHAGTGAHLQTVQPLNTKMQNMENQFMSMPDKNKCDS